MGFRHGVLSGEEVGALYADAKQRQYALPAINVVNTSTINAVLESARDAHSAVIIQLSHGGGYFYGGKGLSNADHKASVLGAISASHHVHTMASYYGVSVILHTDHAARKLLGWIDALLDASQAHKAQTGHALFSSHMLDLSEEALADNIETCVRYFTRMKGLDISLEMELGVTGGEEDGVDNTEVDSARLYTQPQEVFEAYERLRAIGPHFTVAAAFGNVHGVYKPGNVKLKPALLDTFQDYIQERCQTSSYPVDFVFHGGSGSSLAEIREAISYGVVKMNLDTDMQWAFCQGVHAYHMDKHAYLQSQIGNPEGADRPNKKYYDPRVWLREGEKHFMARMHKAFKDLNCIDKNK